MADSFIPVATDAEIKAAFASLVTNHVIPSVTLSPNLTPRTVLADSSTPAADRQQTVAGENVNARIIYGRDRVGGQIAGVMTVGPNLYLLAVWAYGECDAIETVEMWDATLPSGVSVTHHLGTQSQTYDSTLRTACASQSPAITYGSLTDATIDALRGWCYSVFVIPDSVANGFPSVTATIRGRKVALTSGGTPTWTDNPAYCLADFIENTDYGMGRAVDWTSVAAVASACDAMIGSPSEKRRTIGLSLINVQDVGSWLQTLRAYAGCMIHQEAGTYVLIPRATASSEFSFDKTNVVEDSLTLTKTGIQAIPTVVTVNYTDTTVKPWRDVPATIYAAGVLAGTTPRRVSQVSMPGVNRFTQAIREATERINGLTLCDLTCQFTAFDLALKLQYGRVFDLTHPIGLTAKLFRCTGINDLGGGRYQINGMEYDPAEYSDIVVSTPTYADTTLPQPGAPPVITGLTLAEESYRTNDGWWNSRIKATWTDPGYPYTLYYIIEVYAADGTRAASGTSQIEAFTTQALQEKITYTVHVRIATPSGGVGPDASTSVFLVGKPSVPSDPLTFYGYSIGGVSHFNWTPSNDFDLRAHELRWGSTGGSWSTATLLDFVATPTVTYDTTALPVGPWRVWLKARDSVRNASYPNGQESANALYVDVVVTLSPTVYAADDIFASMGSLVNMVAYGPTGYATAYAAATWNATFTSALNTYTNPLLTYHAGGTSSLTTGNLNHGSVVTAQWIWNPAYVEIGSGSVTAIIQTSPDGSAWTSQAGLSYIGSAQYVRGYLATTGTLIISDLGHLKCFIDGTGNFVANGGTSGTSIAGAGQATTAPTTASSLGGAVVLQDTAGATNNGGMLVFAAGSGSFAAIKGLLQNSASNTQGWVTVAVRAAATDANLTAVGTFSYDANYTLSLLHGVLSYGLFRTEMGYKFKNVSGTGTTPSDATLAYAVDALYLDAPGAAAAGPATAINLRTSAAGSSSVSARMTIDATNCVINSGTTWLNWLASNSTIQAAGQIYGKGVFQGHGGPMYSVAADNSTDDTTHIQNAIDAAIAQSQNTPNGMAIVQLGAGLHKITAKLTANLTGGKGLVFRGAPGYSNGAQWCGTLINCVFSTSSQIGLEVYTTDGYPVKFTIEDISFYFGGSASDSIALQIGRSGYGLAGNNTNCVVRNVFAWQFPGDQIKHINARCITYDNVTAYVKSSGSTNAAFRMVCESTFGCGDTNVRDSTFIGTGTANQDTVVLQSSASGSGQGLRGVHFDNVVGYYGRRTFAFYCGASSWLQDIFMVNCACDGVDADADVLNAVYMETAASGLLNGVNITGLYAVNYQDYGVVITTNSTSGSIRNISISGSEMGLCDNGAVNVWGGSGTCDGIIVSANKFFDCGNSASGSACVVVNGGVKIFNITNNTHTSVGNTVGYMAAIGATGTCDGYAVSGNTMHSITGTVLDNGTGTQKFVGNNYRV